jgi:hypothetical protein
MVGRHSGPQVICKRLLRTWDPLGSVDTVSLGQWRQSIVFVTAAAMQPRVPPQLVPIHINADEVQVVV